MMPHSPVHLGKDGFERVEENTVAVRTAQHPRLLEICRREAARAAAFIGNFLNLLFRGLIQYHPDKIETCGLRDLK